MVYAFELNVGDHVVAIRDLGRMESLGGYSPWVTVTEGMVGRITRVESSSVVVRWMQPNGIERSTWVYPNDTIAVTEATSNRKLGTKPEDTDEITYIGLDHPGIQWLFDDMASYATGKRWCTEYDQLAAVLGIPGRKQRFVLDRSAVINGVAVRLEKSVMARSQAEANEQLSPLLDAMVAAMQAAGEEVPA